MTRRRSCLALVAAVSALACEDGSTQPNRLHVVPGLYRLLSINGVPLPYLSPPSLGFPSMHVTRGDLLLRGDGTFALGHAGSAGFFVSGTYAWSNDSLGLTPAGGQPADVARYGVNGDSIILDRPASGLQSATRYVYRRTGLVPVPVPALKYLLARINGRAPPLIETDTTIGSVRFVARVHFDSLSFFDGMFYRRHRSQSSTAYLAGGDSTRGSEEWVMHGTYMRAPDADAIILLPYFAVNAWDEPRDSLAVSGSSLVRTTQLIGGTRQDTYMTHP